MGKRLRISRKAAERRSYLYSSLGSLGFNGDECDVLRRVSMALHSWFEHECNGTIQRDESTGIPYWHSSYDGSRLGRAQDRERGAMRKLETILKDHPGVSAHIQGDPRGCALYLYRDSELAHRFPGRDIDSVYSSIGVAVCD